MNKNTAIGSVALVTVALVVSSGYIVVKLSNKEPSDVGSSFTYIKKPIAKVTDETESSKKLVEFTKKEFLTREVLKVTDNVYVAIGFALANSIMIVGDDGIIIVDTTESIKSMEEILVEFRKITSKPVKAILFTHFHSDHVLGTSALIEEGQKLYPNITIEIYSHELTKDLMNGFSDTYDVGFKRGLRQLGSVLPKTGGPKTGSGIGPALRINLNANLYVPTPTITYSKKATYTIAGIEFVLLHTPGETKDQTTIFLPKSRVIFPGDNIYKTFPNLYAIRGSPARDAKQWYQSLDKIRALNGEYLVGSHTRPVIGKEAVYDTLLVYRDAIKYVHDQTLRQLNKGYFPGEIVDRIKLPDNIAKHPHLQEHYGTVDWSIRGIFTNYLGWFSGDPKDLHPMSASEFALKMTRLVAYAQTSKDPTAEVLLQVAQLSHTKSNDFYVKTGMHIVSDDKWALELVDIVLELDDLNEELLKVAKQIKISALRAIGVEEVSPNGRNYYLTNAMEIEAGIKLQRTEKAMAFVIKDSSVNRVLEMICSKVKGLKCQNLNYTFHLQFTDVGKEYALTLRNSVCDVIDPVPSEMSPQAVLVTTVDVFKSVYANETTLEKEVTLGNLLIESGNIKMYKEFMECFDSLITV